MKTKHTNDISRNCLLLLSILKQYNRNIKAGNQELQYMQSQIKNLSTSEYRDSYKLVLEKTKEMYGSARLPFHILLQKDAE
eukprot:Pgem_evm1s17638